MRLSNIPKIELHCHLEGILDPAMVALIQAADPTFPINLPELRAAYPLQGVDAFRDWFRHSRALFGHVDLFIPVLEQHIARLIAQNVQYSEIILGGGAILSPGVVIKEAFQTLKAHADSFAKGRCKLHFVLMFERQFPPRRLRALEAVVIDLYEAGLIVGVAIAGPEKGHSIRPFRRSLARFREVGLGIEIHAGEHGGPESVWDAIIFGNPQRIGHGVSIFQDQLLIDLVKEREIHLEMCPTSNLSTGAVARIEDHPLLLARQHDLSFSVSTDDPGAFGCSMNSEYELLASHLGFGGDDFTGMYAAAKAARFKRP